MSHKSAVHRQIAMGVAILLALYGVAFLLLPVVEVGDSADRLIFGAKLLGFISLPLLAGIGATVVIRYNDGRLIQGYRAQANDRLSLLQAYNSNTVEQTVLQALSLAAFCASVPQRFLVLGLAQAAAFLLGRVLFYAGYRQDPLKRLTGFAMGYYPAIAAIIASCSFVVIGM